MVPILSNYILVFHFHIQFFVFFFFERSNCFMKSAFENGVMLLILKILYTYFFRNFFCTEVLYNLALYKVFFPYLCIKSFPYGLVL